MSDLSLFDIDSELHQRLTDWQEAPAGELQTREEAIREYVGEVIRSVDPVRRYIRFCDSAEKEARGEAQSQTDRARMWAARRDRLKGFVQEFMSQWGWKEGKPRKFESATGSLSLRGNGGLQPLTITDPALVPLDMQVVTVRILADRWARIVSAHPELVAGTTPIVEPFHERIRAALQQPCENCNGAGRSTVRAGDMSLEPEMETCPECHGTKTASVPGCRLEPRGESLVIK